MSLINDINVENQEGMNYLKGQVKKLFDTAELGLQESKSTYMSAIKKYEDALEKSTQERIERKNTIVSNLAFFIASIFADEYALSSMFGKQRMPKESVKALNEMRNSWQTEAENVRSKVRAIDKFYWEVGQAKNNVLENEELMLRFVRECTREDILEIVQKCTPDKVDTAFFCNCLGNSNLMDEKKLLEYINIGAFFSERNLLVPIVKETIKTYNEQYSNMKTK